MDDIKNDLETFFSQTTFRPGQSTALTAVDKGQDVVVVLPTSSGKSLIFQLAGIRQRRRNPGTWTLVISPLVALIHEQVHKLNELFSVDESGMIVPRRDGTIAAVYLGAGQEEESTLLSLQQIRNGAIPFVYMSPEKLCTTFSPDFFTRLNLLVVDECHCISDQGLTFRPTYRRLREFIPRNHGVPTVALTATATLFVEKDVVERLQLQNPVIVRRTVIRSNLCLRVLPKPFDVDGFVRPSTGRTLIYVLTRKVCDYLSRQLVSLGIPAVSYHAGLEADLREDRAEQFRTSLDRPVLVATIAYGLGMDVPDIRLVIHAGLPKSLLGYVQEIGRGGRDGKSTDCVLYFDSCTDMMKHTFMMTTEMEVANVKSMLAWARTKDRCRCRTIMECFGEDPWPESRTCGYCDVCCSLPEKEEILLCPTNVLLLVRALEQTGNHHGRMVPIDYLLGKRKKNILTLQRRSSRGGGDEKVFGKGRHLTRLGWMTFHRHCVEKGHIREICTPKGYVIFKVK